MAQRTSRATARPDVPNVLAIVVTHRGRRWLGTCLASLAAQTYPLLDVLVVDDATPDFRKRPHLKRIAKRHLGRRRWGFLRSRRSLGFGGAINWALSRVRTDADLLLFLHDDSALDKTAVEKMVARLVDDEATAIVGPKVVAWERPDRLEEVGMAADRLGYPYKGLDEDELDLGQHDASREVFYVSSTCMLMRHDVFRTLRGFDSRMRAFSEDMDICWRARIAGFAVRVEPAAVARHEIALARGYRDSPFFPPRYYIRRNRLRTLLKNVSALRLLVVVPLYFVLAVGEMIGFLVLRQPSEMVSVARGLAWNLLSLPQTIAERARVQRSRKIPDRKIDRFTVREVTRIRAYLGTQTDRLEGAWGRRAEMLKRPGLLVAAVARRLRGGVGVALFVALIAFLLAFRDFLWAPPASVGELLPFPERTTGMFRAWATGWRGAGLGETGAGPPALALLGIVQVIALGAEGVAQKLLVVGLGGIAFAGARWMVADALDRPSQTAAGIVYALGAVGFSGVRNGALGALVFGAAAPFAIGSMLRLVGWLPLGRAGRSMLLARVALAGAVSAAFVPGAIVLYAVVAAALEGLHRLWRGERRRPSGLRQSLAGLGIGLALLIPWLFTWPGRDGPLGTLLGSTWRSFARAFADDGMSTVLLGQTPDVPVLFGLALPLLGLVAVGTALDERRRAAVALWALVVVSGAIVTLTSAGILRPIVASPQEAAVPAAVAFAGLAGLAVGAFRMDLPRRGLGRAHAITLAGVAAAAGLMFFGLAPPVLRGAWEPGRGTGRDVSSEITQVGALLAGESEQVGQFRALWVGARWAPPLPSVARVPRTFFVTGPRGLLLTDLFERVRSPGDGELERVVDSIRGGDTDRGGALLAAFNVRYVILARGPGGYRWLSQRDLAVLREHRGYLVLENKYALPRAGVYRDLPRPVVALAGDIGALPPPGSEDDARVLEQSSSSSYSGSTGELGEGTVYLSEDRDDGWAATIAGEQADHIDAGWANAWTVDGDGNVAVRNSAGLLHALVLVVMTIAWLVVAEAAVGPRRARGRGAPRDHGPEALG